MPKCINKVIVFDLDDTIGHFEQVSMFLSGLQLIVDKNISDKYLYKLLDLWPQIFRPGIIDTLETIGKIKKRNKCVKIIIYTNNMGPRSWTLIIKRYLERKMGYNIFDKVITAYRPHKKHNCRTTHSKTYNDLLKCTGYNENTDFLFLDDQSHPHMIHHNIKYLKLHPYDYGIPFHTMINTFTDSPFGNIIPSADKIEFKKYMYKYMSSGTGFNKYVIKRSRISKKDIQQFQIIRREIYKFLNIHKTRNNKNLKRRHTQRSNYE
jgi:hypothetical protein